MIAANISSSNALGRACSNKTKTSVHREIMRNPLKKLLFHHEHVCPWWCCFTFDNFLRKLLHNPEQILRPYVTEGNSVLDIGPGMGYFSIPLARMVGQKGRVTAADIQPEMLKTLQKRAKKSGVEKQIITHVCKADSLGLNRQFDFILAFWMVHEVPNKLVFFKEIKSLLKLSGKFLFAEPVLHVNQVMYEKTVETAESVGLVLKEKPKISLSRSALFTANY
jgi:2-polyprenyl-3-methyl-5-hydroxy-6-metoxy-1,4-benzoquinol methylase